MSATVETCPICGWAKSGNGIPVCAGHQSELASAPCSDSKSENVSTKYFSPTQTMLETAQISESRKSDLVSCGVKTQTQTHTHKKGARVRIFNGCTTDAQGHPTPKLEGVATIVKPLDVDEYYQVRFEGERQTYQRFVNHDAAV